MKILFLLILASLSVQAMELDLDELCLNNEVLHLSPQDSHLQQKNFAVFQETDEGVKLYDHGLCSQVKKVKPEWRIRMYASHAFTHYFATDLVINTSRYDLTVMDYEWIERGSREYFSPKEWKKDDVNPFQMLDEPTNTFTISFEKNENKFFISYFHPKYLQQTDQIKRIVGKIDGQSVDMENNVAPSNADENDLPIIRNTNSFRQMEFSLGYGRQFTLLDKKWGTLSYTPSVSIGMMMGKTNSVVYDRETSLLKYFEDNVSVQGFGVNFYNRLEYKTPWERIGVFYENKFGFYDQKHGFLDGTQEYYLKYMSNNVGISFNLGSSRKKR